jgi:sulfur-carrier protein
MARVTLIGPLKTMAGATGPFEIDARSVRGLLAAVAERYPDIAAMLDDGVAVAIDGQIFQDALLEPVTAESDIQILPPIAGG